MTSKEHNTTIKRNLTMLKITLNKSGQSIFDKLNDKQKAIVHEMDKDGQIKLFSKTSQEVSLQLNNAIAEQKALEERQKEVEALNKAEMEKNEHLENKVLDWCNTHKVERDTLDTLQVLLIQTTPTIDPKVIFSDRFKECVYIQAEKTTPKRIKREVKKEKEKLNQQWATNWKNTCKDFASEIKTASDKYVKSFVNAFESAPEMLDTKSFSSKDLTSIIDFNGSKFKVSIAVNVKPISEKDK